MVLGGQFELTSNRYAAKTRLPGKNISVVPLADSQLAHVRKLNVAVLDQVKQLLGIDGKGIRVVRAREAYAPHVDEEAILQRPLPVFAQRRVLLKALHTSPRARVLTRGDREQKVGADAAHECQVELVNHGVVPLVLWRAGVWVRRNPATEEDRDAARPEDVDASAVSARGYPPCEGNMRVCYIIEVRKCMQDLVGRSHLN